MSVHKYPKGGYKEEPGSAQWGSVRGQEAIGANKSNKYCSNLRKKPTFAL